MNACVCPKGHESTEEDYCSECGARIEGAVPEPASASEAPPNSAGTCPECGVPRESKDVVFCEICGYNFVTGARGELPLVAAVIAPEAPEEGVPAAIAGWEVVVTVDPALREPGSPEVPVGLGPFTFPLDGQAKLIGRKSEVRAIFPEIALAWDDAVSHRHALLEHDGAGWLLRDIGSANGTRLNGAEVPLMTDRRLADGDQIAVGHWTCITVKAVH